MKYIIATLAICLCFQLEATAQHHRKAKRRTVHRSHSRHHRTHHRQAFYRTHNARPAEAPTPYRGDNTPINDGQKKNVHRNMNYNSGQPLPSNNGK